MTTEDGYSRLTLGCCSCNVTDNYGGTVLNTPTVQPGVEYAQQVLTQFNACVRLRLRACEEDFRCMCIVYSNATRTPVGFSFLLWCRER